MCGSYFPDGIGWDSYTREISFDELSSNTIQTLLLYGVDSWESLKYKITANKLKDILSDSEHDLILHYLRMND
jgi:hypothetical protein